MPDATDNTRPDSTSAMRVNYTMGELHRSDLPGKPAELFASWFTQAQEARLDEPNAMTLATATPDGQPSARTVLCKGFAAEGIKFFTNYKSRKGQELAANPHAAAVFLWKPLEKQICVRGRVEKLSKDTSEAYFHSRPYDSQIGALASDQSSPLDDRSSLERRAEALRAQHPEGQTVPIPEYWGGFLLVPETWEFWQGRASRLHDRFVYTREGGGWAITRLNP